MKKNKRHILNIISKLCFKNSASGFTLVEILVAGSIFTLILASASGLFFSAIRAQRQNLALQQLLDQTSYVMEYMSRSLRMAVKDDIEFDGEIRNCLGGFKVNYEFQDNCLKFRNYQNECQYFCLEEGIRLKEVKGGNEAYLTSPDLEVVSFNVTLTGETQNDYLQPLVYIFLEAEGKEQTRVQIQTSVSQRNLDVTK